MGEAWGRRGGGVGSRGRALVGVREHSSLSKAQFTDKMPEHLHQVVLYCILKCEIF